MWRCSMSSTSSPACVLFGLGGIGGMVTQSLSVLEWRLVVVFAFSQSCLVYGSDMVTALAVALACVSLIKS